MGMFPNTGLELGGLLKVGVEGVVLGIPVVLLSVSPGDFIAIPELVGYPQIFVSEELVGLFSFEDRSGDCGSLGKCED